MRNPAHIPDLEALAALAALARAVGAEPGLVEHAQSDDAFAGLREDPRFQALTGG